MNSVTTIECTWGYIDNEKEWLFNRFPNLKNLFLSVRELPSIEIQLSPILNEKIQQLDRTRYNQLRQLIMFICIIIGINVNCMEILSEE